MTGSVQALCQVLRVLFHNDIVLEATGHPKVGAPILSGLPTIPVGDPTPWPPS